MIERTNHANNTRVSSEQIAFLALKTEYTPNIFSHGASKEKKCKTDFLSVTSTEKIFTHGKKRSP
jgi:hypothetical protein